MCLKLRSVNVDGIWVQDPRRGKTIRYVSTVRIGQIYTVCKNSTCVSAVRAVKARKKAVAKKVAEKTPETVAPKKTVKKNKESCLRI